MKIIKGLFKILLVVLILFTGFIFWDSYKNKESSDFCKSIEMTDSSLEISDKAKSKKYRVEVISDELWIYTQPQKTGLYQEGVACVVVFNGDEIVGKHIRAY